MRQKELVMAVRLRLIDHVSCTFQTTATSTTATSTTAAATDSP